ncbi:MAG: hypothetical protein ACW99A_10700 [Candidatus Kariarchaeaceae archaeon]|jgi:hypothetical protein
MELFLSIDLIVLSILATIILGMYFKVFRRDTNAESAFFTIDTARTMRFMFSYIVSMSLIIIGIYLTLPFLVFGFLVTLALILFLLVNILILIGNIILFIFGSGISFISPDIFSALVSFNPTEFLEIYFLGGLLVIVVLLYTFSPILAGRQCGKYAEDKKSVTIIGLTWFSFFGVNSLFFSIIDEAEFVNSTIMKGILLADYFLFIFFGTSSFNKKLKSEDYDLPEIKGWKRIIYFIEGLIPIMIILTPGIIVWVEEFSLNSTSEIIESVLLSFVLTVNILFSILIVLFYLRGDHPVDQKISEIESREDLLEMAKEFRDLDPSNIEDFVRKSGT